MTSFYDRLKPINDGLFLSIIKDYNATYKNWITFIGDIMINIYYCKYYVHCTHLHIHKMLLFV